ncbi:unnamed protein product [Euphydryas editha]|uniref:CCHC-type domain-containing protein n=1 Tax=Euphydryas editha TaxID=104508 RepID=A0AAU9TCB8_EUPED|nr:unnamed protein product [Euphydryas editha]
MGVVVALCPIAAAKTIAGGGRILVGWSSARIQVLKQRALRCFKCMVLRHTYPTCLTAADKGKQCYRCGIKGHLARACTRAQRCVVCADAGRPASHLMRSWGNRPNPSYKCDASLPNPRAGWSSEPRPPLDVEAARLAGRSVLTAILVRVQVDTRDELR